MDDILANPEDFAASEFREAVIARKSNSSISSFLTTKGNNSTTAAALASALAAAREAEPEVMVPKAPSDAAEAPRPSQAAEQPLPENSGNAHPASTSQCDTPAALDGAYAALFDTLLKESCRTTFDDTSKEVRNSLLALLSCFVECRRFCAALHERGTSSFLVTLAATPDLQPPDNAAIRFQAVTCDQWDHEMRRLLWSVLTSVCEASGECRTVIMQQGFMRVLLLYVDLEAMSSQVILRWSAAELQTLRRRALSSLFRLVPICADDFHACDGAGILLQFVKHAGEPSHVQYSLRVLNNLAVSVPAFRERLGSQHAVSIARECFEARESPQELRLQALTTLHSLCTGCPANVQIFEDEGLVEAVARELTLTRDVDPVLPNDLCMELVAITWTVVASSPRGLARFLRAEGMDALLDHLERGNIGQQPLILSLIADMLKASPLAHEYWRDWRSERSQVSAPQLLLALWRELEGDKGLRRDGVITNEQRPLEGTGKRALFIPKYEVQYGFLDRVSKEELRMITNAVNTDSRMRKVYAVLHLTGFSPLGGELDAKDRATLTFVEKYIKFKQGEVWADMATKFHTTGFRPTGPDRERLQSGIDFAQYLATIVAKEQQNILLEDNKEKAAVEKQFYQEKTQQAQQEYQAKFYKKDKSQVSAKEKQEARLRKEAMLAASGESTLAELRRQIAVPKGASLDMVDE